MAGSGFLGFRKIRNPIGVATMSLRLSRVLSSKLNADRDRGRIIKIFKNRLITDIARTWPNYYLHVDISDSDSRMLKLFFLGLTKVK